VSRTITKPGILLVLLLSLTLAACSGGDNNADTGQNPQSAPLPDTQHSGEPALPLNDDGLQIVARINDHEITLPEFERVLARSQQPSPASYDAVANSVLNTLIEQQLIIQRAAAMGISVSEEEVDAELAATRALMANDSAWQAWLADNHFTEDEFRASLRELLITDRVRERLIGDNNVTSITEVRARHILVKSSDEAATVIEQLSNGASFVEMARQHSEDITTRDQGGDLGWFTAGELIVPELADVAIRLEPGQFTGPLRTVLGYHIIQTVEVSEREATPQEQAEQNVVRFSTWLRQQMQEATVERFIN
jgi:parvulin-like peptidyl-prolyl isomerase